MSLYSCSAICFLHYPIHSSDRNSVLAQTSLGNNGDSSSAPSSLRYEATNLTIAISGGLSVRLWTHRNFKLLWDQARSDVVVPFPGAALAAATNADARFAFAAVQHETTRGLATITLYAPDRGGGAEGHKVRGCLRVSFASYFSLPVRKHFIKPCRLLFLDFD